MPEPEKVESLLWAVSFLFNGQEKLFNCAGANCQSNHIFVVTINLNPSKSCFGYCGSKIFIWLVFMQQFALFGQKGELKSILPALETTKISLSHCGEKCF